MGDFFFYLLAGLSLVAAVNVVTRRSPVVSALFLVATFFCLAGIFLMIGFPVFAAIQILVYAGAIMVLFLFVIMLLQLKDEDERIDRRKQVFAWSLGALLPAVSLPAILALAQPRASASDVQETGRALGAQLLGDMVLPFELTGILILVSVTGVMVLASRLATAESVRFQSPVPEKKSTIRLTSPTASPEETSKESASRSVEHAS